MQLVIISLAKRRIVQRNETVVYDRGLAVIAMMGEFLVMSHIQLSAAHIVVVQMAVCLACPFITANMFQRSSALFAVETLRMKPATHSVDNPADDRFIAFGAYDRVV